MYKNLEFAVTDVETTGLFPNRGDRIIEISVLRLDWNGSIIGEYTTLVNPNRDIGSTDIHGIAARDVKNAPSFEEIAGDVLSLLAGAVFVAHNVSFDKNFVQAEMTRLGHTLPEFPSLCTMQLARRAEPSIPHRRLECICQHLGIELNHAHSAQHDARATAGIMTKCFSALHRKNNNDAPVDIGIRGRIINEEDWPWVEPSGKQYTREDAVTHMKAEPSYIAELVCTAF